MTHLLLSSRIGQFALAAAAVALILVAFDAPAVTEAAGGAQGADAGASENFLFTLIATLILGALAVAAVGGVVGGALSS